MPKKVHQTVEFEQKTGSAIAANQIFNSLLKQAVYRAVYVEVNAKLQADASRLGPIEFLSEGETRTTQETIEGQVERPWQLWKLRARQAQKQWLDDGL